MRILSVGAAIQDVFLSQSDALIPVCINPQECFARLEMGSKADVNKIDFSTGGGATNAAVTFARQGIDAIFMGSIGNDPAGVAVINDLDQDHVDTSKLVHSPKYNTGYSVLLLAPGGERIILTYRGSSTHYDESKFSLDDVSADWMYVSTLSGNFKLLNKLFHQAREKGIKIMFNPGKKELSRGDKLKPLLEDVDVLLVNKQEASQIVSGQSLEELVRRLHVLVPVAIVSDGSNGVVLTDGKTIVRAGMYEDVKIVDRTGAGDAFGSGFLSQWAKGKNLAEAIVFASANATSVVRYIGAKRGLLRGKVKLHAMPLDERPF